MDRIPILRVDGVLLASVQVDLDDERVHWLQTDILDAIDREPAMGVVTDVSAVEVLDTFTARALAQTARMTELMGTPMLVSGLSPAVAVTLTEMGFAPGSFACALNVDSAVRQLRAASRRRARGHGRL